MKDNISKFNNCYGCGLCVKACPVHIISLEQNSDGFYSPAIHCQDSCIECRVCLKICAFNDNKVCETEDNPIFMAGWSDNPIIRLRCSSGGVGYEVGSYLIKQGYKACGVKYNIQKRRAEHFVAGCSEQFALTVGSKYIQSYPINALGRITRDGRYFFVGTPCQVDSMRRYIRHFNMEDNFVLMDFFCHGVPSYLLWNKYIAEVESRIGEIGFVSWRNKKTGWEDSWSINADRVDGTNQINWHDSYNLKIKGEKHSYQSRWKSGDLFYKFFLGNYCLNHCCYNACKYKELSSAADIRIGDLWGKKYKNNQKGVNGVIAFTKKGKEVLNKLEGCTFESSTKSTIFEGQMSHSPKIPRIYKSLLVQLRGTKTLNQINNGIIKWYRLYCLPKRCLNFLCYRFNIKPIIH